jgi:hypothetical protein
MPEEMPISETIELARGLDAIGLSVGCVVANAVVPPLFSAVERASLVSLSSFEVRSRGDAAIGAAIERARREGVQAESLSRLSTELGLAPVVLPLLFRDAATPDAIRELALHV